MKKVKTIYGKTGFVVASSGCTVTVQMLDGSFEDFHHTKVFAI